MNEARRQFPLARRMSEQQIKDDIEREMTWRIWFNPDQLAKEIEAAKRRLSRAEKDLTAVRRAA